MEWKEGELMHASIHSDHGTELRVKYKDHSLEMDTEPGETCRLDGTLNIQ